MTDKTNKNELTYLKTIQSLRSDEYNINQHENIFFDTYDRAKKFSRKVLNATEKCMDGIRINSPEYKIEGIVKDALLKLIKDAIDYDSKKKYPQMTNKAYSNFNKTLIKSEMLFVSKSDLEFLTFFNRKLIKKGRIMRAILGEDIHVYNCKVEFYGTKFLNFSTFIQKIKSLRSDEYSINQHENIFFKSWDQAKQFSEEVLNATKNCKYKIEGIVKDALLKLIKDAIDYDSKKKQMTDEAYSNFRETLIESEMLFESKSDLEFLTFFNRKLEENNIAKLDENINDAKATAEFKLKFFKFSPNPNYSKQFHYLVHSVHDTELLPYIFNKKGIQLKGHSNKDYHGLPLIWFGLLNENKTIKISRYGSISFMIKIDKVLAKGTNYFAMGTRKYRREHSHSILITNRKQIQIQTKLKTKNDEESELSEFMFDFPEIPNIEENELCKKVNNEWFLNDGLQLDENLGAWDHPEFCLEANEGIGDNDEDEDDNEDDYANFCFDDIKICFLEHGESNLCVKKEGKKTGCRLTRESSMKKFIALIKSRKIPSLLKLRNCFEKGTFQELFELQFGGDLLKLCKFELNVTNTKNLNNIQARFNEFKNDLSEILKKLKREDIVSIYDSIQLENEIENEFCECLKEDMNKITQSLSDLKIKHHKIV